MDRLKLRINSLLLMLLMLVLNPVQAYDCVLDTDGDGIGNGTAGANSSDNSLRVACGENATASGSFSTAVGTSSTASMEASTAFGNLASATGGNSTAIGRSASAAGDSSTALGESASAAGFATVALGQSSTAFGSTSTAVGESSAAESSSSALGSFALARGVASTAIGRSASASGPWSTAVGFSSDAHSEGAVALGSRAGENFPAVTDSPQAIAIGEWSNITAAAPGAIAIGGDVNGDNKGAIATAPGAIAIGADVVADIANTLITNVPILARDPDTTVVPRTMFEISGFGNTKFTVTNADANEQWAFANPGTGFRLSRQGSGSVEFEVKNNGNVVIAGNLTENSDRNNKQDIQAIDQHVILDKVMALPISQWSYKDDPQSKHIGPMAQDFYQVFELGHTDKGISTLDSSGVALAAIQALNVEKDSEIAELKSRIGSMQFQLMEMKELKEQLASVLEMIGGTQLAKVVSD